jgi:hypothetical protein
VLKENQELRRKMNQLNNESRVLKNGIKIQNRKIGEND